MTEPTDTNQASEDIDDILFEAIESAGSYIHKLTATEADYIQEQAKEAILAIIRNEKLKLLAEVRELVIGEDLPPDVATDSGIGYSRQQFAINMGKAGQRRELTKLEAEL